MGARVSVGQGFQRPGRRSIFKGGAAGTFGTFVRIAWHHLTSQGSTPTLRCCKFLAAPSATVADPRASWAVPSRAMKTWLTLPRFQRTETPDRAMGLSGGGRCWDRNLPWGQGLPLMWTLDHCSSWSQRQGPLLLCVWKAEPPLW